MAWRRKLRLRPSWKELVGFIAALESSASEFAEFAEFEIATAIVESAMSRPFFARYPVNQ